MAYKGLINVIGNGEGNTVAPDPDATNQAHGDKIFHSMPGSFQGYGRVYFEYLILIQNAGSRSNSCMHLDLEYNK